jgi:hypothetical protein
MADSEHLNIRKVEETEFADSSSLNDFSHDCTDYYQKYVNILCCTSKVRTEFPSSCSRLRCLLSTSHHKNLVLYVFRQESSTIAMSTAFVPDTGPPTPTLGGGPM